MGAKSETEIITISTNFSFVSYDTDEGIFNVSIIALDFCLDNLTFFRVLRYILCPIVLNIAAVTIFVYKCIYLMAFTMCDRSYYVTACLLFIH